MAKPLAQVRQKYVPDLKQMQTICDRNYTFLANIIPHLSDDEPDYSVATEGKLVYRIRLKEDCRYTSIITIKQTTPGVPNFLSPELEVRVYHDAKMAEVVSFQNMNRIKPSYQYPNPQMHQKDEKLQLNLFLAEWLSFCLKAGYKDQPCPLTAR